MKQTILFVINDKVSYLPPFQALIDTLLDMNKYHLVVIASEDEPEIDKLYEGRDVDFIHYYTLEPHVGYMPRIRNKYKRNYILKNKIEETVKNINYDILWIIHEYTAVAIPEFLKGKDYILSCYELKDNEPKLRTKLNPLAHDATVTIACEENRAWMMKVWYKLQHLPFVIPNKPYNHPREKYIENDLMYRPKDKVILYQGIIDPQRNLDGICEAASRLKGYKVALMGSKAPYLDVLKSKYSNVEYIGFAKSPFHLRTTSNAHIGVVTYAPISLNCVYCAPNKIWEYSGFGIPMLANDVPGLANTVGKAGAGVCTNMDNVDSIFEAIKTIEDNYDSFSANAIKMYESYNLTTMVEKVITAFNQRKHS